MINKLKEKYLSKLFIDIRGEVARVIQGRSMDKDLCFSVDSFGAVDLPGHMTHETDSKQLAANAKRLRKFLDKNEMTATKAVIGLGQNGIITRNVEVPKVTKKRLQSMIKLNISDYLPVSPEEYAFDYKVLKEVSREGRDYLELMAAAVNHTQVEQCATLLELAGLEPIVFDILPNMLQRLFGYSAFQDLLVVDGGWDGTHINIFKGNSLFVYGDIYVYNKILDKDIPFVVNLQGDNDFYELSKKLSGYLDYFSSRNFGKNVDGLTIIGELTEIPNLVQLLEQYISIPITVGLSETGLLSFKGNATDFAENAAVYAGNLGLMLRENQQAFGAVSVPSGVSTKGVANGL